MNRNKYFMAVMCALLITSGMVFAEQESVGYWSRFKQGISSMPQSIWGGFADIWYYAEAVKALWNHPRSSLQNHTILDHNGKKFEAFIYNTLRDSEDTKRVREEFKLFGLYFSDGSDWDIRNKYLDTEPEVYMYLGKGFRGADDHSISACMFRFFKGIGDSKVVTISDKRIYLNLLGELDNTLSRDFDKDQTGNLFIDYAQKILSHDSENKLSLQGILSAWKKYSYRFMHNKGLQAAIDRTNQNS